MSTKISFDEEIFVDGFVPPFGWIPCERISEDMVKFDGELHDCNKMAPLYSRSLKTEFSTLKQGQGVLVYEGDISPTSTPQWLRGTIESVDGEDDIIVRTINGSTLRVRRDYLKPFFGLTRTEPISSYEESLAKQGFQLVSMRGDGNCLFRSISHQIYNTPEHHLLIRKACADYMEIESDYFEPFVAESSGRTLGRSAYSGFKQYCMETRKAGIWGDDPELQAMCELYQRPVEIYYHDRHSDKAVLLRRLNDEAVSTFFSISTPMRLSFKGGGHYDSIISLNINPESHRLPSLGVLEKTAIEMAKTRRAGGITLATKLSDELETEKIQLEEALRRSRQMCDQRRSKGFNLQEALSQSLKSALAEDTKTLEAAKVKSIQEAEDEELAKALKDSMKFSPVETAEDEDELLRLAIEESLRY